MWRSIWKFILDSIDAMREDDRQLRFDFGKQERERKKRFHRWLFDDT